MGILRAYSEGLEKGRQLNYFFNKDSSLSPHLDEARECALRVYSGRINKRENIATIARSRRELISFSLGLHLA